MGSFIPINSLESNENIYYQYDKIEKGLNILSCEINHKPRKKTLQKLTHLLHLTEKEEIRDKEVKKSFIKKLIEAISIRIENTQTKNSQNQ